MVAVSEPGRVGNSSAAPCVARTLAAAANPAPSKIDFIALPFMSSWPDRTACTYAANPARTIRCCRKSTGKLSDAANPKHKTAVFRTGRACFLRIVHRATTHCLPFENIPKTGRVTARHVGPVGAFTGSLLGQRTTRSLINSEPYCRFLSDFGKIIPIFPRGDPVLAQPASLRALGAHVTQ